MAWFVLFLCYYSYDCGLWDFTPKTDLGKIFTIIYIFVGLGIRIGFITPIGEYFVDRRVEKIEHKKKKNQEGEIPEIEAEIPETLSNLKGKE